MYVHTYVCLYVQTLLRDCESGKLRLNTHTSTQLYVSIFSSYIHTYVCI